MLPIFEEIPIFAPLYVPLETYQLALLVSGKDLDEYIDERAGLVDLLNDSKSTLKGQPIGINVDFNAVEQSEHEIPQEPFPRKPRPTS